MYTCSKPSCCAGISERLLTEKVGCKSVYFSDIRMEIKGFSCDRRTIVIAFSFIISDFFQFVLEHLQRRRKKENNQFIESKCVITAWG